MTRRHPPLCPAGAARRRRCLDQQGRRHRLQSSRSESGERRVVPLYRGLIERAEGVRSLQVMSPVDCCLALGQPLDVRRRVRRAWSNLKLASPEDLLPLGSWRATVHTRNLGHATPYPSSPFSMRVESADAMVGRCMFNKAFSLSFLSFGASKNYGWAGSEHLLSNGERRAKGRIH